MNSDEALARAFELTAHGHYEEGVAAERARLLPVMEQMACALQLVKVDHERGTGEYDYPYNTSDYPAICAALDAYAAALAPSATREEGERG